jgi:hypothetical protein
VTLPEILEIVRAEARRADNNACAAMIRSKYSIQDYHLCMEQYLARLHDRLAIAGGLPDRCPHYAYRQAVLRFRRAIIDVTTPQLTPHYEGRPDTQHRGPAAPRPPQDPTTHTMTE